MNESSAELAYLDFIFWGVKKDGELACLMRGDHNR